MSRAAAFFHVSWRTADKWAQRYRDEGAAGGSPTSTVAYAETHDDEKAVTATGVLCRAVAWFAERGVSVERGLSDNGSATSRHHS